MLAAFNGAMVQWAIHGEGTLGAWVEDTLAPLFVPLQPGGSRVARMRKARRKRG